MPSWAASRRLALLLLAASAGRGLAQETDPDAAESEPAVREPGVDLQVDLVTIGPGRRVWERFGHNAIRVRDTTRAIDRLYNYGMFSFDEPGFMARFVRGEMDYWMGAFDSERMLAAYAQDDRTIWAQELDLTPAQRLELFDFLEDNARPENRFYRYDYYLDNCSTRVRDALDRVLDGGLAELTVSAETGTTYRSHTRRLLAPDIPAYAGTLFSESQAIDRPITAWEEMFLPVRMMEYVRNVKIVGQDGRERPLVRAEYTAFESTMPPERSDPPSWWLGFLAAGLAIAALFVLAGRLASTQRGARIAAIWLGSGWALFTGVGGVFMLAVWLLTAHWAGYRNENLFFFSPVALPLALLIPLAAAGKPWAVRWSYRLALAVLGLSALGVILKILPGFMQVNGEIIAFVLPVNVALARVIERLTREARGPGRLDGEVGL